MESLLEFPCDFPIKIMGKTQAGFAQAILNVVLNHIPEFNADTMEMRPSKHGKYLSLTCIVYVTSRDQLDNLYKALCDHPMVVMVI